MTHRIAFVTSHPIQYQAPVFRQLAALPGVELKVLFAMVPDAQRQGHGFGVPFSWDLPLLEGYEHHVLKNVSQNPGVTHYSGCDTPDLRSELKRFEPDAVIVNGWVVKTCLQALWACKRLGVPCLVRGEANDLRHRAAWKRAAQRVLVKQYAAALYIGSANREFYLARGVEEKYLFPSLYCVENERFAQAAAQSSSRREELRGGWQIDPDDTCFLFCGKFENKKHPLQLLEAVRLARDSGTRIHLLMVGDGELRRTCEQLAISQDLPVTFTGFLNQTEIVDAYVAADCLVLPSDAGETWGLVVNEAMACARPAIVSDQVGCGADLVTPGETGDSFPFGDWRVLADRLIAAAQSRPRLAAMGQQAETRVAAYSPLAAAQGIRDAVSAVGR